ncbi:DUF2182 domain-containing protein [Devosia sp. CN2-171]|uniref:DUF2182 domain-containing protein n=1 Tax=Devosia sp. CN2-171 TaxID=3400909 RepID=UPI003BF7F594
MSDTALEAVLRRDRLVTAVALTLVAILAWGYVAWFGTISMPPVLTDTGMDMRMDGHSMASQPMDMRLSSSPWSVTDLLFLAAMWTTMMVGMMTPSAAPMILLYARVGRSAAAQGKPFASTAWFAAGYLLAWTGFALVATGAQWGLQQLALLGPMMQSTNRLLGGGILVAAGIYQFTPLKNACLGQCRAPLNFIQEHGGFRRDAAGSLRLGLLHGLYCVGCCWALMVLLFVGGVMNPVWIAGIVALVLVEKLAPAARWVSRGAGALLLGAGVWVLATA